jgi:uncharacterized protein
MAPPFVFFDLRTRDVAAARAFYTELFGWPVTELPMGGKQIPMFADESGPWAGFTPLTDGDERAPQWVPYAQVDDLGKATEQATSLGATVVRERTDLPVGSLVVINDPTGATLVLWEPRAQ